MKLNLNTFALENEIQVQPLKVSLGYFGSKDNAEMLVKLAGTTGHFGLPMVKSAILHSLKIQFLKELLVTPQITFQKNVLIY